MNLIRVKAFPDAKKEHVEEVSPNVLRIFIRESAERNMANHAVIKAVAKFYNIPEKQLIIKTGHRAQNKTLLILGS
jgi:uncharacterized protein YggU (UPF0235/DUF167 family)